MGNENLNWLFSTEDCNIALSKSLYQVPLDACYKCGGNTILRSRDHRILIGIDHAALGFGTIAAHGHADALSFQMYVNGLPVFIDPGTYIYHCDIESRNAYRKTENHNTVCINGRDQSEMDIEDLEKQAEAIRVEQIKLYESYADGVLLRDAYIEKKKALSEKLAALQDSIRTEKEEQECADELDEEIRALTKQASEKTYIGGLTKECVDAFVSMVYLYDDQTMKIEFNCEDVIRRALEKYGA